ncbi:hypothetical protein DFH06DRAFT_1424120 [Mycena polygramma]|nr:hypothetical protein DFH06DRAFT_1424120 [Mycena polygramma]
MLINGKPFIQALPPLPRRPLTNAQRLAASDIRQSHQADLSQWLKGNIYYCPNESDLYKLDADEVLCTVRMRYRKADDDGSIFQGPDLYHLFLSIETPSCAGVPSPHHNSPHLMLGHWSGSHEDGDAPDWTKYMCADRAYTFSESRPFMARFVCGLTPIWVGDVSQQTVSPRMMNWAVANARGTRALTQVTLQRRRLMLRLSQEIVQSLSQRRQPRVQDPDSASSPTRTAPSRSRRHTTFAACADAVRHDTSRHGGGGRGDRTHELRLPIALGRADRREELEHAGASPNECAARARDSSAASAHSPPEEAERACSIVEDGTRRCDAQLRGARVRACGAARRTGAQDERAGLDGDSVREHRTGAQAHRSAHRRTGAGIGCRVHTHMRHGGSADNGSTSLSTSITGSPAARAV